MILVTNMEYSIRSITGISVAFYEVEHSKTLRIAKNSYSTTFSFTKNCQILVFLEIMPINAFIFNGSYINSQLSHHSNEHTRQILCKNRHFS